MGRKINGNCLFKEQASSHWCPPLQLRSSQVLCAPYCFLRVHFRRYCPNISGQQWLVVKDVTSPVSWMPQHALQQLQYQLTIASSKSYLRRRSNTPAAESNSSKSIAVSPSSSHARIEAVCTFSSKQLPSLPLPPGKTLSTAPGVGSWAQSTCSSK